MSIICPTEMAISEPEPTSACVNAGASYVELRIAV
jgi:hypothetical protein